MDCLAAARRHPRKSILLSLTLAFAASALPCFAQDAATTPAPAVAPAQPAEPTQAASKPTPPDAAKLITPKVVAEVKKLLAQPVTVISIGASNDAHGNIDQAGIDKLDGEWKSESKVDKQPLIAEMLSSPLSNYLLYLQAQSAGLYTEMFVMDNKGLNVGQSSVTSDYWQGDEAKYQKTFQVGPDAVFIDEAEFNDDSKTWRAQLNFTLVDPQSGKPIGAATIEMNLTELERRQAQAL
ncbi:hypothetical protein [Dongia sedimenti]|uniref:Uncharacterized protein n=1 Tax=Dongia sedimenti TaxID=3064282 RepID=A0ABU0YRC6_9PROT|nr:hypothetical protein [Rhodospirillaceae bacterium R-7]